VQPFYARRVRKVEVAASTRLVRDMPLRGSTARYWERSVEASEIPRWSSNWAMGTSLRQAASSLPNPFGFGHNAHSGPIDPNWPMISVGPASSRLDVIAVSVLITAPRRFVR
jgi:hypothetical protein